jgi:NADH dehydrogenase
VRINHRLVNACIRADAQADPVRPGQLHGVIVGGGATGTELAAELHRTTREVVAFGLDRIDPERDIHITLIEAADRILPALPRRIWPIGFVHDIDYMLPDAFAGKCFWIVRADGSRK